MCIARWYTHTRVNLERCKFTPHKEAHVKPHLNSVLAKTKGSLCFKAQVLIPSYLPCVYASMLSGARIVQRVMHSSKGPGFELLWTHSWNVICAEPMTYSSRAFHDHVTIHKPSPFLVQDHDPHPLCTHGTMITYKSSPKCATLKPTRTGLYKK